MIVQYEIDENDFLTYQLFVASKSEHIAKKRRTTKVRVPIVYVIMALVLFFVNAYVLGIVFLIIAVLWFVLWPLWERRHYVKHYKLFIKENYKNKLGRVATLEINDDALLGKDNGSESKLLTSEIEEIFEISTLIFIRVKGGQAYILPKDRISNATELVVRLKELASHLNVKYSIEMDWAWK